MPLSLPLRGCAAASPAGGDFREEQTTHEAIFTKTGIWLLAAAATIAVVLCVVSALSSGTGLLHNALGVIASPFRAAGSAVASWVGGISQRFEDVETLQQENDELRQQIAELEEQLRQMEPAATENKELRQLLGLRQQRSDLVFEAARVTQRDVSNWAAHWCWTGAVSTAWP